MIILVDFGSQTAHLIARRIRECGAALRIVTPNELDAEIKQKKPRGIVLSGGPDYVAKNNPTVSKKIFTLGIPILGICYGHQVIAHELGGKVRSGPIKEFGPAMLSVLKDSPLFSLPSSHFQVWMNHGDEVIVPAPGFSCIAKTETNNHAVIADEKRHFYGIQFHPEAVHTKYGTEILANFLKICGITPKRSEITQKTITTMRSHITKTIGDSNAICGLSGGIDSSVAAVLVHQTIGKRLTCIYVDSGLMRKGETDEIKKTFSKHFKLNLILVNARDEFIQKLKGITDPEKKRLIIGELFIRIFEREAKKIKNAHFLVQGTIYPDVIESKGTKHADKIKSHHNVGGLPKDIKFTLVEPLRELYKDEVRRIAALLKFPKSILTRQPFPGPGLAIRIIGEVTAERLDILRHADAIVRGEIIQAKLWEKTWQAFAVLTGARSTGIRGDSRSYGETIAVRVVEAVDAMTAHWSRLPYDLLDKISSRIVNEIPGINRVVYDITNKPPATMEWE